MTPFYSPFETEKLRLRKEIEITRLLPSYQQYVSYAVRGTTRVGNNAVFFLIYFSNSFEYRFASDLESDR